MKEALIETNNIELIGNTKKCLIKAHGDNRSTNKNFKNKGFKNKGKKRRWTKKY